jgi:hypothetical protein
MQPIRHRRRAAALACACVAALASCSSSDDDPATPETSADSPATAPSSTGSGDADTPTQASTPPVTEVAREDLELAVVSLKGGGGPDWMASGFGSLWVKRDNNVVARVAPDGKVLATMTAGPFAQPVCQGLGVGKQAVWACANPGKLMRIDPKTNEVAAVVSVPKVNEQGRLTYYGGRIWVLTGDGDELVGVSESDNELGEPIDLGAYCTDLSDTVAGSTLWVVCPYDNTSLRVDLKAGKVTGKVRGLPKAAAVTVGDDVWVCTRLGVARVDPQTLEVLSSQPFPSGFACSMRVYGDTVWVRSSFRTSPFAGRVATSNGQLAQVITTDGRLSGGDVIEFGGALWVSSFEEAAVYKLKLEPL